jgi:hypothetical protein
MNANTASLKPQVLKLRVSSVLKPDAPAKDRGYTLPTANWRSTYAHCLAHDRRFVAHNPSLARQASADEVTAEIQDATEPLKRAQHQNLRFTLEQTEMLVKTMTKIENRVALVTGAGRRIGRAIAIQRANAGAKIATVARTRDELDEVVATIQKAGGSAAAVQCDLSDRSQSNELIGKAADVFGAPRNSDMPPEAFVRLTP